MPLHLLDNLANLTDPTSGRNALELGVSNSPSFSSITLSSASPTITFSSGGTIVGNTTITGNLTASGIVTSPDYTVTGVSGAEMSISKSVTTWEFGTKTFSVNTQATTPRGIDFNDTGTRVFVLNSTTGAIGVYQYNLSPSSPWDITTAAYSSVSKSLTGVPVGIKFSTDGLYMFISNDTGDKVDRYTLVNPWDLNTVSANPDQTYTLTNVTNGVSTLLIPRGIDFNPDGTRMYVTDDSQNSVYQFNLVTPWSVNTAAYSGNTIFLNVAPLSESSPVHAVISSDGTRLIVTGTASDRIWEFTLPTPYSLAGAFLHGFMRVALTGNSNNSMPPLPASSEGNVSGIYYNDILNKCFFVGTDAKRIQEIIVNPQILLTGERPFIRATGADLGAGIGAGSVRINRLRITDSTGATANDGGAQGALTVAGGIGAANITVAGGIIGSSLRVNDTGAITFNTRSQIQGTALGVILMGGSPTVSDFTRLQFGGIDTNFPAIKRNGSGIDIVNAANTVGGFTNLRAKDITATGPITFPSTTVAGLAVFSASSYTGAMIYVSDGGTPSGGTMVFSDGVNWIRVFDNTILA